MSTECIFCKIIAGSLTSNIVHEDNKILAFEDVNPQAPVHHLIVPKEHIPTINDLLTEHNELIGQLFQVAKTLAKKHHIAENGYRVVMNCNEKGGQAVYHIHLHLLGDRQMHWPPG
ncbi:MAG: histidine triad nucleotide-binding protein [Gammaproteobacteria bacterium RIFCSPHIGHO2_12_FULL_35_23]|nr:MAG: histidine triad nucleotide-binding protein [Gammaproteobacteria bacterium RIFCSPHIGHO2_12_FULL_35_23]